VDGANRHDKMLVKKTFDALIFERPSPDDVIQNICMDKGYDYPDIRELVKEYGFTAHIQSRGEENIKIPGFTARRWVVERTHLAKQISKAADKVGKENWKLPCYATFSMRMDNIQSGRTFRIGSK
jgi:transposase